MRVAAILGLGTSMRDLRPFQQNTGDDWVLGLPSSAEGLDAVAVFGGDGTLHRNLGALVRLRLPVLVVPTGSGNDFARAIGVRKAADALTTWRGFAGGEISARPIDLGVIQSLTSADLPTAQRGFPRSDRAALTRAVEPATHNHYFACVAGIGLDAEIARRANGYPRWLRSRGGYAIAFLPSVATFSAFRMKLSISDCSASMRPPSTSPDNAPSGQRKPHPVPISQDARTAHQAVRYDGPTVLLAFANTPFYGGGMKIAPEARLDDGEFDVCLVKDIDSFKLFGLFPSVYFGRHLGVKEVDYFRAVRARVETEYPIDVYADGEYVCKTPVEFGVERAALSVIALGDRKNRLGAAANRSPATNSNRWRG